MKARLRVSVSAPINRPDLSCHGSWSETVQNDVSLVGSSNFRGTAEVAPPTPHCEEPFVASEVYSTFFRASMVEAPGNMFSRDNYVDPRPAANGKQQMGRTWIPVQRNTCGCTRIPRETGMYVTDMHSERAEFTLDLNELQTPVSHLL